MERKDKFSVIFYFTFDRKKMAVENHRFISISILSRSSIKTCQFHFRQLENGNFQVHIIQIIQI